MSTVAVQRASTPNALTRRLYDYMNELYQNISRRAFSIFEENGNSHGHDLDHWLKAEAEFLCPAPLEIVETDSAVTVRAESVSTISRGAGQRNSASAFSQ